MAIGVARIAGLLLVAATFLAPWGDRLNGAERVLAPLGWPGAVFLLPPILFVFGFGFVAWLLAAIAPHVRFLTATLRGFLLILGLTWIVWVLSFWSSPAPFSATWGGWLFPLILVGMAVAERKLPTPGRRMSAIRPWAVVAGIALLVVLPLWIWHLTPKTLTKGRLGDWADAELARLVDTLEKHHAKHGSFPREFSASVNCEEFPRENVSASVTYAEIGLDDYALGVIVQYTRDNMSWACGNKERTGFFTSKSGGAGALPPFLAYHFNFFLGGKRTGKQGRWSFWKEGGDGRGRVDYEGWRRALEDSDANVRAAAAAALGRANNPAMVAALVRVLLHDEDEGVRGRAAWALGRLGDTWALVALRKAKASPAVTWAIAQLEPKLHERRGRSGGRWKTRYDFDSKWPDKNWLKLGSDAHPEFEPGSMRIAAGECAYVVAYPRQHHRCSVTLRVVSGRVEIGFVEQFGKAREFFNSFRLEDGRVQFVGVAPVPLGSFEKGEWVTVTADLDFVTRTATLKVGDRVVAEKVAIVPYRFNHEQRGLVQLYRWGIAGDASIDSIRMSGSGWSLD